MNDTGAPVSSPNVAKPLEEKAALEKELDGYRKLREDPIVYRVFEKAQKRLIKWASFGGLAVVLLGVLSFLSLGHYVDTLAAKAINALIENKKEELLLLARTEAIAAASRLPIGTYVAQPPSITASNVGATRATVDLSQIMTPVREQGNERSSLGFALTAALEAQWGQKNGKHIILSPRYLYYLARLPKHSQKIDSGAYFEDAIDALKGEGAVLEAAWPYKEGAYASDPPPLIKTADRFHIREARGVRGLAEIKAALLGGAPVIASVPLFGSFQTIPERLIPNPSSADTILGTHPVCIVGFDEATQRLKFKNSWGTRWGEAGYGYLSYAYADKYIQQAWVLDF